ncbi:MAG: glycine oxidase ThiO, partial [Frankiales bacterium]|nr:glycine oxidase ThiO [Frankiales bacterium]
MPREPEPDVLILGGGVIGLAAAYRAAESGLTVRLLDASGTRGASWAAAGMLAPISEASYGEEDLTRLSLSAVEAFTELGQRLGVDVGLRTEGTVVVALNADDRAALER